MSAVSLCMIIILSIITILLIQIGISLHKLPKLRFGSPSVVSLNFTRPELLVATYDITLVSSNPNWLCNVYYNDVSVALFYTHTTVGYALLASTPINSFALGAASYADFGYHNEVGVHNTNRSSTIFSPTDGVVSFRIELSAMIRFRGMKMLHRIDGLLKVVCHPFSAAISPNATGQLLTADLKTLCS